MEELKKSTGLKIIYMTSIPFLKQHFKDMYISSISNVYDTELWDLSSIFSRSNNIRDNLEGIKEINSVRELENELKGIDGPVLVITNIHYSVLGEIYSVIKNCNIDILTITKESFMNYILDYRKLPYKYENGIIPLLKRVIKNNRIVRSLLYKHRYGEVKFDYLMAANNFYPELTRNFVKIHQVKWDEYLQSRQDKEPIIKEKYVLFLDAAIPHHPMYNEMNESKIDSNRYIKLLNNYFDYIEKKYKVRVVISSHPKSEYTRNDFNGREIIKYQTPNLIHFCEFAIAHYTTSIFNVVLEKKPVVFLYYDEMIRSSTNSVAIGGMEFARRLNAPLIDLKDIDDVNINVDLLKYKEFSEKYIIKSDSVGKSNEELILDFLNNYKKKLKG